MADERNCPECGERLSFDARRCACGWGAKKRDTGRHFDHQCTFKAGHDRCAYPVGLFRETATHGWCIFHRQELEAGQGAEIVRQSHIVPYHEAIKPIIEQNARASRGDATRKPDDAFPEGVAA